MAYWVAAALFAAVVTVVVKLSGSESPSGTPRLFVIGDSQACGATGIANPCGSDPSRPCAKSGDTFANWVTLAGQKTLVYCKIGSHTSEWAAIVPTLGLLPGDVVLVFLGSNDYFSKPDPRGIVQAIGAAGASFLWVGPPAIRGGAGVAPDYLASVLGRAYFDSRSLHLTLADGIHPTKSEFARWMGAILRVLQP